MYDHLLAYRGITVVTDGWRGITIPVDMPLTALKPVDFLRNGDGDGDCILGTEMQKRALDESGPCFAPRGRDLLWRIHKNMDGEGRKFLASMDRSKYYALVCDQDLQGSDGNWVVLFFDCSGDQWFLNSGSLVNNLWHSRGRVLTLDNSAD